MTQTQIVKAMAETCEVSNAKARRILTYLSFRIGLACAALLLLSTVCQIVLERPGPGNYRSAGEKEL